MQQDLRSYIDHLREDGYTVRDDHGEDPDLIDPGGNACLLYTSDAADE